MNQLQNILQLELLYCGQKSKEDKNAIRCSTVPIFGHNKRSGWGRAYCNVVFQLRPAQQTSAAKRNHGDYDQNEHDDHENG